VTCSRCRSAPRFWSGPAKPSFSADRAAIIVVQDPEVVFSALFKLTGGSPKIFEQMDREEYLKQAEDYERPDWSRLDKFYKVMLESDKTHPIRCCALRKCSAGARPKIQEHRRRELHLPRQGRRSSPGAAVHDLDEDARERARHLSVMWQGDRRRVHVLYQLRHGATAGCYQD
jgi:hypothetical protein